MSKRNLNTRIREHVTDVNSPNPFLLFTVQLLIESVSGLTKHLREHKHNIESSQILYKIKSHIDRTMIEISYMRDVIPPTSQTKDAFPVPKMQMKYLAVFAQFAYIQNREGSDRIDFILR